MDQEVFYFFCHWPRCENNYLYILVHVEVESYWISYLEPTIKSVFWHNSRKAMYEQAVSKTRYIVEKHLLRSLSPYKNKNYIFILMNTFTKSSSNNRIFHGFQHFVSIFESFFQLAHTDKRIYIYLHCMSLKAYISAIFKDTIVILQQVMKSRKVSVILQQVMKSREMSVI